MPSSSRRIFNSSSAATTGGNPSPSLVRCDPSPRLGKRRDGSHGYGGCVPNFRGFPHEALQFYEQLEVDNSKAFWQANKHTYQAAVQQPMEALLADLQAEFGAGRIFRPYPDI